MSDEIFERYDILTRGSRPTHEVFETRDELEAAVRAILSPSELRSGVLERLTSFNPAQADEFGTVTLSWRNVETWATVRPGVSSGTLDGEVARHARN